MRASDIFDYAKEGAQSLVDRIRGRSHTDKATTTEAQDPLSEAIDELTSNRAQPQELSAKSVEPQQALPTAKTLLEALSFLAVEKVSQLEEEAADIHTQTMSEADKTRAINDLSTAIMNALNESSSDTIDCETGEIKQLIDMLRNLGIQVPVSSKTIKKENVTRIIEQLNHLWQEHKDEAQKLAQEFQHCTQKRDMLYQVIMTSLQVILQATSKMSSNMARG